MLKGLISKSSGTSRVCFDRASVGSRDKIVYLASVGSRDKIVARGDGITDAHVCQLASSSTLCTRQSSHVRQEYCLNKIVCMKCFESLLYMYACMPAGIGMVQAPQVRHSHAGHAGHGSLEYETIPNSDQILRLSGSGDHICMRARCA